MLKCSWKQVCRIMLLGPGWRMGLGYKLQKHQNAGLAFQTRKPYTCTKPSPESHSHAFSSWFGCKQLWDYSYPVVSQILVNSWVRSEMNPLLFLFCPLSRAVLVCRSWCPGAAHWACLDVASLGWMEARISHRAGDVEHCIVLPAAFPQQGCR